MDLSKTLITEKKVDSNRISDTLIDEKTTFESMCLDTRIVKAVKKIGYDHPTLIQASSIPLALEGKDILAKARTGSGKTAAYTIPIVQKILMTKQKSVIPSSRPGVRAVVLVPTRELCDQVKQNFVQICFYCAHLINIVHLGGEQSDEEQRGMLRDVPDIIISTPTRLVNHLKSQAIKLDTTLEMLVIDEADLVLSYGYQEDIQTIKSYLPKVCQGFLMSATLTPQVDELKKLILHTPAILRLEEDQSEKTNLTEYSIKCQSFDRYLLIFSLLRLKLMQGKILFFVNDTFECYKLKLFLERFHIKVAVLNSELPINSRHHIIMQFNKGLYDYLIATDESFKATKTELKDFDEHDSEEEEVQVKEEDIQDDDDEDDSDDDITNQNDDSDLDDDIQVKEEDEDEDQDDSNDDDDDDDEEEEEDSDEPQEDESSSDSETPKKKNNNEKVKNIKVKDEPLDSDDEELNTSSPISSDPIEIKEEDEEDDEANEESFFANKSEDEEEEEEDESKEQKQKNNTKTSKIADKEYGVARGIDFKNVDIVINFDFPRTYKNYVHRIGRTARGKSKGVALSFVTKFSEVLLKHVQKKRSDNGYNVKPFEFKMASIEGFRYRVEDVLKGINKNEVSKARKQEIEQEIINSEKLKRHFKENPKDLEMLEHDVPLMKKKIQHHLAYVPEYLVPDALKKSVSSTSRLPVISSGKNFNNNNNKKDNSYKGKRKGGDVLSRGSGGNYRNQRDNNKLAKQYGLSPKDIDNSIRHKKKQKK